MLFTLLLLLMLSTLQRKENRLIEQTVSFAIINHYSMLLMHTNVFYTKKEINMILLTLISFD